MKKRPIIICLVVAILGSIIFWLQSNYIITGWLNGEAFYQGRPTSYWRRQLGKIETSGWGTGPSIFFRYPSSSSKWLEPIIPDEGKVELLNDHVLLKGDPAAQGVLKELMKDPITCEFAAKGLALIKK